MKTFKQYISEIAKGIYKGFGMLIIDGQKVDVEVELYLSLIHISEPTRPY